MGLTLADPSRTETAAPSPADDLAALSDAELSTRLRNLAAEHDAWRVRQIDETVEEPWEYSRQVAGDDETRLRALARRSLDQAITITSAWADEMHRVNRHDRIAVLERIAGLVDPATLNGVLAAWWPELKATHHLGHDTIVRLFRRAGYVADNERVADSPTAELTIYRGTDRPAPDAVRGVSWTIDPPRPLGGTPGDSTGHRSGASAGSGGQPSIPTTSSGASMVMPSGRSSSIPAGCTNWRWSSWFRGGSWPPPHRPHQ